MRNSPVEIRPYSEADGDAVRGLISGIQRDEFGMSIDLRDQPDLADIISFYRSGLGDFWVADHDGAIIGTIALIDIGERAGALRKMFVGKEFRGPQYGIADRLLDALLTSARRSGLERIFLGTAELFHAAHRFYRRHGFEEIAAEALPASFPIMSVDTRFFVLSLGATRETHELADDG